MTNDFERGRGHLRKVGRTPAAPRGDSQVREHETGGTAGNHEKDHFAKEVARQFGA